MLEKVKFTGFVIACLVVVYVILSITMPFVAEIAYETANDTSVAAFGSAQAGLRWVPLFLWIFPGVAGLGAIWWRLRKSEDNIGDS